MFSHEISHFNLFFDRDPLLCCAELSNTAILLKIIGIDRWLKCKTWCFLLFFVVKSLPFSIYYTQKRIPLPRGKAMRQNPVIFKRAQSGRISRAEHLSSRPDNACRRVCVSFPVYHLLQQSYHITSTLSR